MSIDITTPRLRIGPFKPSDAAALSAYRSHPDVLRFQSLSLPDAGAAAAFIAGLPDPSVPTPDTWTQLAVRLDGALVGDLGLHWCEDPRQVELGVTIDPAWQRRGLAAEALRGLIGHLFGAPQVHRVHASVDPRNAGSLALLRRVGLRQEAWHRQSLWEDGAWVDDVIFAVLASEWPVG
jgi:RimJ/RimL family protein N-acetyltransferase